MRKEALKEELEKLKEVEGSVRGEKLRTHAEYIERKEGEEGLEKVEETLKEMGYPLKLKEVKALEWYPVYLHPMVLLCAYHLFDWKEEDVYNMGASAARLSFIGKVMIKYFFSVEKFMSETAPEYWRKYYEVGEFNAFKIGEKDEYLIRIENYSLHPLVCVYNKGYFLTVISYFTKEKKVSIKEVKCTHKQDSYHEYLVSFYKE